MNINLSVANIISIIAVLVSLISLLLTYFKWVADIKEKLGTLLPLVTEFKDMVKRLNGMELAVTKIETSIGSHNIADMAAKLDIFWVTMEPSLKEIIKQPIHFRKDELIDKFPDLNNDELCELRNILMDEMIDLKVRKDPKVLAYALMTARVDSVLYDRKKGC